MTFQRSEGEDLRIRSAKRVLSSFKHELVAEMSGLEAEPVIESMRIHPGAVRGQLDKAASMLPRPLDRMPDETFSNPFTPQCSVDTHRFDLCPLRTLV
jgi:hypothetical protein